MSNLKLITRAVSFGGAETLIQHPASMIHSTYSPEERGLTGSTEGLVRLSLGLETLDNIVEDLAQGIARRLGLLVDRIDPGDVLRLLHRLDIEIDHHRLAVAAHHTHSSGSSLLALIS